MACHPSIKRRHRGCGICRLSSHYNDLAVNVYLNARNIHTCGADSPYSASDIDLFDTH